jgi:hypothetical protein
MGWSYRWPGWCGMVRQVAEMVDPALLCGGGLPPLPKEVLAAFHVTLT